MSDESSHVLSCPACRVIDLADGVEDGNLFPVLASRVGHEGRRHAAMKRAQDHFADRVTDFAGSLNFVYLHAFWFGLWIVCNTGLFGRRLEFDRFPFGLLTMIVSLEAIFLSTFVMVSQNRQAARSELRSQLDYETNLRAEIWAVHIGQALGVDPTHVEEVVGRAIDGSRTAMVESSAG